MSISDVEELDELIKRTEEYVQHCMSRYDTSHDFNHVQRVCRMAQTIAAAESPQATVVSRLRCLLSDLISAPTTILRRFWLTWARRNDRQRGAVQEPRHTRVETHGLRRTESKWSSLFYRFSRPLQSCNPSVQYDFAVVTLASLLHDVGDKKYLSVGQDGTQLVADFLISANASVSLANTVQEVVNAVSYSSETKNPAHVANVLARHPELGPVQDADRLDAIGAVGIGRCFTHNAATGLGMAAAIQHFADKLLRLEGMMKTKAGRAMARERTERLQEFQAWWYEEMRC